MIGDGICLGLDSLGAVGLGDIAVSAFAPARHFLWGLRPTNRQNGLAEQRLEIGIDLGRWDIDDGVVVDKTSFESAPFAVALDMGQRKHVDENLKMIGMPGCTGLTVLHIRLFAAMGPGTGFPENPDSIVALRRERVLISGYSVEPFAPNFTLDGRGLGREKGVVSGGGGSI